MNRNQRRLAAKQQRSDRRAAGRTPDLRTHLAAAAQQHQSGRLDEAEAIYRAILEDEPKHADALHRLGILYAQTERLKPALDCLKAAVEAAPENAAFLNNLGNAYNAAARPEAAIDCYRRALELQPNFLDALFNLANVLKQNSEFDSAEEIYRRALGLNSDRPEIHTNLGVCLLERHRYDEAVDCFERALSLASHYTEAHFNLGVTRQAQGKLDEAVSAYEAALAHEPNLARALLNLGVVHQVAQRLDDAAACYRRAIQADSGLIAAHANLGSVFHDNGQFDEAATALSQALRLAPGDVKVLTNMAMTLEELGEIDDALSHYRRALAADPANQRAQAHYGIALQVAGRRREAAEIFDYDRLVRVRELDRVPGYDSIDAFNAALTDYISGHPTLIRDRPEKSTTGGSQTLELLDRDNDVTRALRGVLEDTVGSYAGEVLATSGNPHLRHVPASWRVVSWAVVLESGGHQSAHIHPAGFCSGVYYVRVPDVVAAGGDGDPGCLKFGQNRPPRAGRDPQAGFLTHTVRPREGVMVQFPSHFWHNTIPFESPQQRISVSFDAVPA